MRFLAEPVTVMTSLWLRSRIPWPITTEPIAIAIARIVSPARSGTRASTPPTVTGLPAEPVKGEFVDGLVGDLRSRDDQPLATAQPRWCHEQRDACADHSRDRADGERDRETRDRGDTVRA